MKKYFLTIFLAIISGVFSLNAAEPHTRLLTLYTGFFLGNNSVAEVEQQQYIPMEKAGFTSVECKIQQSKQRRMNVMAYEKTIGELATCAKKHGLIFQVYLYPEHYTGKRFANWPEHQNLPCFVAEDGQVLKDTFSLADYRVWKDNFKHAFDFAKLSLKYPIWAVKFDIETIQNSGTSYDDGVWARFCKVNSSCALETVASERKALLIKMGKLEAYQAFFRSEVAKCAQQLADEMHAINPALHLGFMPAEPGGWISDAFTKALGTAKAPAIIDCWSMYNGQGYSEAILKQKKAIETINLHTYFVPWFRLNNYMPKDTTVQAYHAAVHCAGYSVWSIGMLTRKHPAGTQYALPGKSTAEEYWKAYGKANFAVRADIKAGTLTKASRIPYAPNKSLVPPLNLDKIPFPDLVPQGSGNTGSGQKEFVAREQQIFYIYAKSGEQIKVQLRHWAGMQRAIALHYAVVSKDGLKLRDESIAPGSKETFQITAPTEGIYALVVTGGQGGQAWYGVQIFNPYFAMYCRTSFYFFYMWPIQIYIPGPKYGNTTMVICNSKRQAYRFKEGKNGQWQNVVGKEKFTVPLKQDMTQFIFEKPNPAIQGFYTQDIEPMLPGGKTPYIYASPERMLVPRSTAK